ncbi:hypothetical protein AC1031_022040 [Aphanomyces cochlioides]|nr:hypothetical protein AC1031_022040 [Aphanomyces cochlioides]
MIRSSQFNLRPSLHVTGKKMYQALPSPLHPSQSVAPSSVKRKLLASMFRAVRCRLCSANQAVVATPTHDKKRSLSSKEMHMQWRTSLLRA